MHRNAKCTVHMIHSWSACAQRGSALYNRRVVAARQVAVRKERQWGQRTFSTYMHTPALKIIRDKSSPLSSKALERLQIFRPGYFVTYVRGRPWPPTRRPRGLPCGWEGLGCGAMHCKKMNSAYKRCVFLPVPI